MGTKLPRSKPLLLIIMIIIIIIIIMLFLASKFCSRMKDIMSATLQRVAHSFGVVFLLPDPIISGRWMVNSGQQCRRHERRGIDPAWRSCTNEKRKEKRRRGREEKRKGLV